MLSEINNTSSLSELFKEFLERCPKETERLVNVDGVEYEITAMLPFKDNKGNLVHTMLNGFGRYCSVAFYREYLERN